MVLAAASGLLLTACGDDDGGSSSDAGAATPTMAPAMDAAATMIPATTSASTGSATANAPGRSTTPVPAPPADRKVIVTVSVDVEVADVGAASLKASTYIEGLGGYVANQQTNFGGPGRTPSSTIVMKVPPAKVSTLLQSLNGLGKLLTQTQQSEDVTATFVDVESRIVAARASVERVRLFMSQTTDVNQLAAVESELTRRETELEQLLGQQRMLSSQTELATVTLTLQPTPVEATPPAKADDDMTVGKALEQGTDALFGAGLVIAIVAAWLAPWLIPAAVVLAAWLIVRRRRRRGHAPAAVTAPVVQDEAVNA